MKKIKENKNEESQEDSNEDEDFNGIRESTSSDEEDL